MLDLGEISSSQERAWRKPVEVFDDRTKTSQTLALLPEDRWEEGVVDASVVQLRLSQLRLCQPRVWGSCWLALKLWGAVELDQLWSAPLPRNRKGARWDQVLFVLVAYRLLSSGSEWRLHRQWFDRSALADLLGTDAGVADIRELYACHDRLLAHETAMFDQLVRRWSDLFHVEFDVLLYDPTSTYFESNPPVAEADKRRFGHSRDHRSDCVQIVLAPVVTPEGLPLAYEVLPGNTADSTTLRGFLERIEHLKPLWARLQQLSARTLTREHFLMRPGAARSQYPAGWRLVEIQVHERDAALKYRLRRDKLRHVRRREGRSLLRTDLTGNNPAELWRYYIERVQGEEAFENLKGDLAIRPILHQTESRIEAHIPTCAHTNQRVSAFSTANPRSWAKTPTARSLPRPAAHQLECPGREGSPCRHPPTLQTAHTRIARASGGTDLCW